MCTHTHTHTNVNKYFRTLPWYKDDIASQAINRPLEFSFCEKPKHCGISFIRILVGQGSLFTKLYIYHIWVTDEPASLTSPAFAGRFFTTSTTWEALHENNCTKDQVADLLTPLQEGGGTFTLAVASAIRR